MRSEIQPGGQKARSFIEEARRDQIVRAAVEVIAEVGFARASLARIAQRAGISKGVISYHFAGKEELMEQVVDRVYAQIGEFVVARMEGAESAAELLRTHIVSVAEHMRANRVQLTALGEIFNNLRTTDGEPRYGVHTSEGLYQALESIYRRGQDRGSSAPSTSASWPSRTRPPSTRCSPTGRPIPSTTWRPTPGSSPTSSKGRAREDRTPPDRHPAPRRGQPARRPHRARRLTPRRRDLRRHPDVVLRRVRPRFLRRGPRRPRRGEPGVLHGFFFLISGFFTPASFDRKGGRAFVRDRLLRLGVPLLVFLLLLRPLVTLPQYLASSGRCRTRSST